ncbi:Nn.00g010120.m01.CDS01 [Neocucurbitaria sp. VM-36]
MAAKVKTYKIPPTPLIPNSPYPLLHYPGLLRAEVSSPTFKTTDVFDLFARNGWQSQWIARYGPDIQSHYHSTTHECMVVISGQGATIRFGVADSKDWDHGKFPLGDRADGEEGGLELQAALGDVFIIPSGVSHKTFKPRPSTEALAFHQPGDIANGEARDLAPEKERARRDFFAKVPMEGEFMMMGAYPYGGVWDFAVGGEHKGHEADVWYVPKPQKDPVLGESEEGLVGLWAGRQGANKV